MIAVAYLLGSYLIGAIPFGLLIAWAFIGADIRRRGSGNIGATNVRRVAGNFAGVVTLAGDVAKGAIPVAVAMAHDGLAVHWGGAYPAVVALAAFIGHLYPVYLEFKGGKGVATAAGGIGVLAPLAVLAALVVFIAIVALGRRVSAGSMAAAVTMPAVAFFIGLPLTSVAVMAVMSLLIVFRHKDNIRRLLDGSEPRIGR
ncbi:MAG: glycerol-3-phosphate 1-O-acyltransferase PlsY [Pseudomonadota bacterium]